MTFRVVEDAIVVRETRDARARGRRRRRSPKPEVRRKSSPVASPIASLVRRRPRATTPSPTRVRRPAHHDGGDIDDREATTAPATIARRRRRRRGRWQEGRKISMSNARDDASSHATLAYGLNLPKKKPRGTSGGKPAPRPALAAFACDSDSDEGDDDDPVKARERANAEVKRQQEAMALKARRDAARAATTTSEALKEDANAFEYDAVFDDIAKSRGAKAKELASERVERQSRYIGDLIAKAEARKKEDDASYERRLLKERLKEDHLFADKDKFVTAAYRAKLQEDAKWLAEDKARDAVEEEEDVTKRGAGAMTSFYSNLMHRNSAMGGDAARDTRRAAPEPDATKPSNATTAPKLTSAADRDRELIARAAETPAIPPIPSDVTLVERPTKAAGAIAVETPPPVKVDSNARRNTEADVSDARARYLERKRKAAGGA
jgi:coiled-coil domain-containing protein 55